MGFRVKDRWAWGLGTRCEAAPHPELGSKAPVTPDEGPSPRDVDAATFARHFSFNRAMKVPARLLLVQPLASPETFMYSVEAAKVYAVAAFAVEVEALLIHLLFPGSLRSAQVHLAILGCLSWGSVRAQQAACQREGSTPESIAWSPRGRQKVTGDPGCNQLRQGRSSSVLKLWVISLLGLYGSSNTAQTPNIPGLTVKSGPG